MSYTKYPRGKVVFSVLVSSMKGKKKENPGVVALVKVVVAVNLTR